MTRSLVYVCVATLFTPGMSDHSPIGKLSFLQTHAHGSRDMPLRSPHVVAASEAGTALLRTSMPLAWLHIPKAGSSFSNALIHTPGVCPGVPQDEFVSAEILEGTGKENEFNEGMLAAFGRSHYIKNRGVLNKSTCPGLYKWGNHSAIGAPGEFEAHYAGKGVAMIRQPEQRLISSYDHNQHDWPYRLPAKSLAEYSQVVAGCTVRMLTRAPDTFGPRSSYCGEKGTLTQSDVALAKSRLEKFAFVGLTEQWDLSICLWRAMFGGLCYGSDLSNTRLAPGTSTPLHDVSVLDGFVDHIDRELYSKAHEIFERNLQLYGVNESSCKACWDHAAAHLTANA